MVDPHVDRQCPPLPHYTHKMLHNFEDQKFANFLNLEQVNFCKTLVICLCLWVDIHMHSI